MPQHWATEMKVPFTGPGSIGMAVMAGGWFMLVWSAGWAMRNCGRVAKLERSGRRLQAQVVHIRDEERTIIAGGWPMQAHVYTVRLTYPADGDEGGATLVKEVNVKRPTYEQVEEGGELPVVVDPDDDDFVMAAAVVDGPSERFGGRVLLLAALGTVPAIMLGGLQIILNVNHCDVGGQPSCCTNYESGEDAGSMLRKPNASFYETFPCEGRGSLTYGNHWWYCVEHSCNMEGMLMSFIFSIFGLMCVQPLCHPHQHQHHQPSLTWLATHRGSFMIVLLRSGQAITAESEDEGLGTACCNCCFGRGEFCGEDDPNLLAMEIIRPQRPGQRAQDPLGGLLVGADATRSAEAAPTGKFAKLETIKESIKREIVPPAGVKADRSVHLLDRSFRGIEGKDAQGKTLEGPCTLLATLAPDASLTQRIAPAEQQGRGTIRRSR